MTYFAELIRQLENITTDREARSEPPCDPR